MSSEKKEDKMNFLEFLTKNKKLILIIVIIIAALLIGIFLSKIGGSIAGIFGLLWGMITGKGDERKQRHDKEIEELDKKLDQMKVREEKLTKQIGDAKKDEEQIRKEIGDLKKKYHQMSISQMIDEHNQTIGY